MSVKSNNPREQAFTLPEVALAIGVVALGLVAVFSVLPFGLTAQKDNHEETVIRYEAQYWREALLSSGLLLEELKRVDRVEVHKVDSNTTHTFINPLRSRTVPGSVNEVIRYEDINGTRSKHFYPPNSLALMKAKKYWSSDVQGWLLNPTSETGPEGNFALVRAMNGSLFDRFYGAEPERDDYHFPNRDFSTGYILQVQAENVASLGGSRIKLTFYWPLFEEVTNMLEPKPTAADPLAKNNFKLIREIVEESLSGGSIPPFKSLEFTIRAPGRIEHALLESDLLLQERRFMKEMRSLKPGDPVEVDALKAYFGDYYSARHTDGTGAPFPRRIKNDTINFRFQVHTPGGWVDIVAYPGRNVDPSFHPDMWQFSSGTGFLPVGHSGMWLYTNDPISPTQIAWVGSNQVPLFGTIDSTGSFVPLLLPNQLPYLSNLGSYRISFLGPQQSWEDLLRRYSVSNPSLVADAGDHYVLSQRLRITTHRPATLDEKAFNILWSSGDPQLGLWDWVPDEVSVPRLWRVGQ